MPKNKKGKLKNEIKAKNPKCKSRKIRGPQVTGGEKKCAVVRGGPVGLDFMNKILGGGKTCPGLTWLGKTGVKKSCLDPIGRQKQSDFGTVRRGRKCGKIFGVTRV